MSEDDLIRPFNGGRSPYCPTCNGSCTVRLARLTPVPVFPDEDTELPRFGPCPDCNGTGNVNG